MVGITFDLKPDWLLSFVNDVVQVFVDASVEAPIGCHVYHDESMNCWEVTLFISRTELLSGPHDGLKFPTWFQLNVFSVGTAFDTLPVIHWQSEKIAADDELGNHLSFEGIVSGYNMWLRILADAPAWTQAGRLVHADTGVIQDKW